MIALLYVAVEVKEATATAGVTPVLKAVLSARAYSSYSLVVKFRKIHYCLLDTAPIHNIVGMR